MALTRQRQKYSRPIQRGDIKVERNGFQSGRQLAPVGERMSGRTAIVMLQQPQEMAHGHARAVRAGGAGKLHGAVGKAWCPIALWRRMLEVHRFSSSA